MQIKNYLKEQLRDKSNCHDGIGIVKQKNLFEEDDFTTQLKFINYTVIPPGTSIGNHKHGNNEEVYVILEGRGRMHVDGEDRSVEKGDVIINKPYGTHGLFNDAPSDLAVFVFEISH